MNLGNPRTYPQTPIKAEFQVPVPFLPTYDLTLWPSGIPWTHAVSTKSYSSKFFFPFKLLAEEHPAIIIGTTKASPATALALVAQGGECP